METESMPTILMTSDRDNNFDSSAQFQTTKLNLLEVSNMKMSNGLEAAPVETRTVPLAVENKIPFIGDVHEDDAMISSWIFPTAALTKSKSSQDIPFVPPVEENGVPVPLNNVPVDGSFVGEKKTMKIFRAALTEEKDIPFVPPDVESNACASENANAPLAVDLTPQDGSFVTNRKSPITKSPSSESRDIDFSPAGSAMATAAPPQDGSFSEGKSGCRLVKTSSYDIDVVPDLAGKDMPTSPPPKKGTFLVRYDVNHAMKIQETLLARTDRDINFSPGASEMTTGPPPITGSYNRGQQGSPMRSTSGHATEIHVLPEDIGASLVVTPPRPGRYVQRIKDENHASPGGTPSPSPKEPTYTMQGDTLENVQPMDASDSWVFPQLEQDSELDDILFSTGRGSALETPSSPLQGSFTQSRSFISLHDSSTHREINVTPDLTGKQMPTAAPPLDGSFSGRLEFTSQDIEERNPDNLPREGREKAIEGEIGVDSQDPLIDLIECMSLPEYLALPTGNERDTVRTNANVEEDDDNEEDDPMKDDQDFWRSQRAWELAKLKQNSLHAIEQANESPILLVPGTDESHGQVIVEGEGLNSNPLADSIHKLGALLGSEYEMKPVDSHDEETDMSHSIQKIGALLGSTHLDDPAHDDLNVPLHDEIIDTTSSDILDDLLGVNKVVDDVEGEISRCESIVDLCALPEFNKRSDSKVHDDDVTVQIENTSKHRISRQPEVEDSICEVFPGETFPDDILHQSVPMELSKPLDFADEYFPGDEMAKLEALLEKELDSSLKDFGKSNECSQDGATYIDVITGLSGEDSAHDEAVDEAIERGHTEAGHAEDDAYVPNDSIARLEAFLDEALDSPIESVDKNNNRKLPGTSHDDDSSTSVNSLDDFLASALDSDVEITFEPTEDEIIAPMKNIPPLDIPKVVPNQQKAVTSRSRFGVLASAAEGKSKQRARVDQLKTAQDPPPKKKPALPKFRVTQKTSKKPVESATKATSAPKEPVFGRAKTVQNNDKSHAVKKETSSSARDGSVRGPSSQNQAALTRTRKIISRFRPWTKRASDSANASSEDTGDCRVPMFTPAESRNKGRTIPVRLFSSRNDSAQRKDKDVTSKSINPKLTHNQKIPNDRSSNGASKTQQKIQLTNIPSLPQRPDFYGLSSLARSASSLSSTCSVTYFRSPRREGIRGCQQKFNPYLHDVRGPCELCVFFLSAQDRAALDAQGRHVRVMFTTGGCCRTCAIFPRSFADQPARLCRQCYFNSHRLLLDRKAQRGGRGVQPSQNLSSHDESSSEML